MSYVYIHDIMNDFILYHLQRKWKCNLQWKEMATSANNPQPPTWHASADHADNEVNRAHKSSRTGVAVIHLCRSVDPHLHCLGSPRRVESDCKQRKKQVWHCKAQSTPSSRAPQTQQNGGGGSRQRQESSNFSCVRARAHSKQSIPKPIFLLLYCRFFSVLFTPHPPTHLFRVFSTPSVLFSAWNSKNRSCSGWTSDSKLGGEGNAIHGGNFFGGWQGFWSGQCFCYLWQLQQAWRLRPSLHLHPSCWIAAALMDSQLLLRGCGCEMVGFSHTRKEECLENWHSIMWSVFMAMVDHATTSSEHLR